MLIEILCYKYTQKINIQKNAFIKFGVVRKLRLLRICFLKLFIVFRKKNNETPFVIDPSKLKAELPWLGFTDD